MIRNKGDRWSREMLDSYPIAEGSRNGGNDEKVGYVYVEQVCEPARVV